MLVQSIKLEEVMNEKKTLADVLGRFHGSNNLSAQPPNNTQNKQTNKTLKIIFYWLIGQSVERFVPDNLKISLQRL